VFAAGSVAARLGLLGAQPRRGARTMMALSQWASSYKSGLSVRGRLRLVSRPRDGWGVRGSISAGDVSKLLVRPVVRQRAGSLQRRARVSTRRGCADQLKLPTVRLVARAVCDGRRGASTGYVYMEARERWRYPRVD
jgi:hypothetical protein